MKNISITIPARIRNLQEAEWLKIALASVPKDVPVVLVNDHSVVEWGKIMERREFPA